MQTLDQLPLFEPQGSELLALLQKFISQSAKYEKQAENLKFRGLVLAADASQQLADKAMENCAVCDSAFVFECLSGLYELPLRSTSAPAVSESEAATAGADVRSTPDGNHGDNLSPALTAGCGVPS